MRKNIIYSAIVAAVVSIFIIGLYIVFIQDKNDTIRIEHVTAAEGTSALYRVNELGELAPLDFTEVAARVVESVVHIRATQTTQPERGTYPGDDQRNIPEPFREFFGPFFKFDSPDGRDAPQVRMGTGSGVIINEKGYIVTNNHVISGADDLEVTLHDNRIYKASIVGTDPSTDLALIRIEEDGLPVIKLTDSEDVKVGQWVLAVGNPLGLNSTVTAGIVSAKGRNINILREKFAVESFIQTDAAINPGNSGGALVNLQGALIGINTAIASPTGTYAGYGFAVPSNIANKVIEDLLTYGAVQRGVLGIMIRNVDGNLAKEKKLDLREGVYIDSLLDMSAAREAGLQVGDVITRIDDKEVNTSPELQSLVAQRRPGDEISVTVNRKGKERSFNVILNNREGRKNLVTREYRDVLAKLGADFESIDKELATKMELSGGVQIVKLYVGKLRQQTKIREGFIITHVDGQVVTSIDELADTLANKNGGVMLEGIYEEGREVHYYAFGMNG